MTATPLRRLAEALGVSDQLPPYVPLDRAGLVMLEVVEELKAERDRQTAAAARYRSALMRAESDLVAGHQADRQAITRGIIAGDRARDGDR